MMHVVLSTVIGYPINSVIKSEIIREYKYFISDSCADQRRFPRPGQYPFSWILNDRKSQPISSLKASVPSCLNIPYFMFLACLSQIDRVFSLRKNKVVPLGLIKQYLSQPNEISALNST